MTLGLFESFLLPGAALHGMVLHGHQAWLRREAAQWDARYQGLKVRPPCLVVGGLRMKGSGKSSMTAALARLALKKGLKVAILAYARPTHLLATSTANLGEGVEALTEVTFTTPWREASDEALMHKVLNPACRVYVTRHRAAAYMSLATSSQPPDLVLCDDGLFDPRLTFARRWVLLQGNEEPSWRRLFPAGPQRGTWAQTRKTDHLVYEILGQGGGGDLTEGFWRMTAWPKPSIKESQAMQPGLALCAHAHAKNLMASLAAAGLPVQRLWQVGNHRGFPLSELRRFAQAHPGAPLYCGPRDAVKVMQDCGLASQAGSGLDFPAHLSLGLGEGFTTDLWVCRHQVELSPQLKAWFGVFGNLPEPMSLSPD